MYIVYVISNPQGHIYIGQTNNLGQRLVNHNSGRFPGYTARMGGPWGLVYTEECFSRSLSLRREKYFKHGSGHRRLKELINNMSHRGVA